MSPIDIIHDAEKGIAAMIDPEAGRALGPIAMGETAVRVLDGFGAIHGVDPATLTPATLERRFEQFIETLLDVPHSDATAAEAPPEHHQGTGGAPIEPGDTRNEETPPTQAALDEAAAKQVERADALGAGTEVPSPKQAPADPDTPQASPAAGQVMCPTCDGFRTVVANNVVEVCPVCKGAGVLDAHRDAQAQGGA